MATVQIGDTLGRYELIGELGQGGMSVVYRARDTALQRDVAVKVMHGFLSEQPESRERFRREARAVAALNHPHIIEIFDYSDEAAEVIYMVAELVANFRSRPSYMSAELLHGTGVAPMP